MRPRPADLTDILSSRISRHCCFHEHWFICCDSQRTFAVHSLDISTDSHVKVFLDTIPTDRTLLHESCGRRKQQLESWLARFDHCKNPVCTGKGILDMLTDLTALLRAVRQQQFDRNHRRRLCWCSQKQISSAIPITTQQTIRLMTDES